jgi:hypothetical protein
MVDGISSGEPSFCQTSFGHDACGCTFINNAVVDCDILDFNWYLKSDKSEEAGFSTIEIKCDESSISRVDCPLEWKVMTSVE